MRDDGDVRVLERREGLIAAGEFTAHSGERLRQFSIARRPPVGLFQFHLDGEETGHLLRTAIGHGFSVVLANKKPLAGSWESYAALHAAATAGGQRPRVGRLLDGWLLREEVAELDRRGFAGFSRSDVSQRARGLRVEPKWSA